jgi:hypothetical protein
MRQLPDDMDTENNPKIPRAKTTCSEIKKTLRSKNAKP